tara:strand:+ start:1192 stop:3636 length:2445 start_codon:yes stop_codon:yes gene_type:complete
MLHSIPLGILSFSSGGYGVDNSAMFNDDDTEYLTRTPSGSATSRRKFTMSAWVKRGNLGTNFPIFSARSGVNSDDALNFTTGDKLEVMVDYTNDGQLTTNAVFRDPHAWYNIVLAIDTEQSTAADRLKLYVNNVQMTSFSTASYPAEDYDFERWQVSGNENTIGRTLSVAAGKADGYMAEVVWIDGQQLTPSSFGETDDNGVWRPVDVTGLTFGNYGYYLDFETAGSDLGDDASGNSNDFTNTNSVTQTSDSPTKNYVTLSPLSQQSGNYFNGNTKVTAGVDQGLSFASFPVTTGQKVYIEATCSGATSAMTGCVKATAATTRNPSSDFDGLAVGDGRLLHVGLGDVFNSDTSANGAAGLSAENYAPNDSVPVTHMIALDLVNDKIYWGDAGVGASGWSNGSGSFNQTFDNAVGVDLEANLDWFFTFRPFAATIEVNFGATAFAASPPTGYSSGYSAAIENSNRETALTIEDGSAYHQGILWSGNSSSQTVSQTGNSGFTPDMTIIKSRSFGNGANIYDVVRGSNKGLATFDNGTEDTESDGVTFGISSGKGTLAFTGAGASGDINNSGRTYVGLTWKAGGSAGSNGNGSITSSVSAETTSGFSIVSWEGSGGNATIGHGLGVVPKMIWIRNRDTANNWVVYHVSMGNAANLHLDDETAKSTGVSLFQSTDPTTTVFSVDGSNKVNKSGDEMIAYCFADVPGFQKLGVYKGNGSTNGPFVETGFKPAFVLIRSEAVSTNTEFFSNIIEPTNVVGDQNFLNIPNAEADNDHKMDWLSNGFKIRDTSGSINASGANIIFWAIGENSFAGNTPVTAR